MRSYVKYNLNSKLNIFSRSFEDDKFTLYIFIELCKAFDKVDDNILFNERDDMKNESQNYFRCYLSNRKWFMSYGEGNSSLKTLICDVPEGSRLGPFFCLVFE